MSTQSGKAMKMSGEAARNCLPGLPHFLLPPPIILKPDGRFCDQSKDRNKKLPANLAGKSHSDTVELCRVSKQNYTKECLLDDGEGQSLLREESREG